MPRANRVFIPGLVWHLTHRCHDKAFLLRFRKDRRRWRHWLFEATRRYGLSVLNFIVTSNHIHLLAYAQTRREIPRAMQLIASRTAQEYNLRKNRCGAFWEDRYHATAVESNDHLLRCMTYIDLNMVRAGAVSHAADWDTSGYGEIQQPRQRRVVIDLPRLHDLLGIDRIDRLSDVLRSAAESACHTSVRDPAWTEAAGIGSAGFVAGLSVAALHVGADE